MADKKLTIRAVAVGAWRDGFAALTAQRTVVLTAFLALTLINLVPHLLMQGGPFEGIKPGTDPLSAAAVSTTVRNGAIGLISALVASLALTPLAIAVHRFILLGETTSSYRLELGLRRFRRFAFYTFLLNLIALMPAFFGLLVLLSIRWMPVVAAALVGLTTAVVAVAGGLVLLVLMVRLTLLFPAVAVDAPRAGWNRALDESRGQFWRIFLVLIVTALIGFLVFIGEAIVQAAGGFLILHGHLAPGAIVSGLGRAATNVLMATVFVAAASLLYRDLAQAPSPQET